MKKYLLIVALVNIFSLLSIDKDNYFVDCDKIRESGAKIDREKMFQSAVVIKNPGHHKHDARTVLRKTSTENTISNLYDKPK